MSLQIYGDTVNLTYLHIPNCYESSCVGTCMFDWMRMHRGRNRWYAWMGHPPLEQMKQDRPDIDSIVAIVRNPWERVLSYYQIQKDWFDNDEFCRSVVTVDKWPDFEEFLLRMDEDEYYFMDPVAKETMIAKLYCSPKKDQFSYLSGHEPEILIRMEDVRNGFRPVQELFGSEDRLTIETTPINGDYQRHYTSTGRDIVARWHQRDIEAWNYDF